MVVQAHTARLIALFVSCVLYGILLTTFISCLRSLLFSASQQFRVKPRHEIKWPIVAATISMFIVSTFSAVVSMQDVIDAFIKYDGPGGALAFYNSSATTASAGWLHWVPAFEDSVQVILGDGLLVNYMLARCRVSPIRAIQTLRSPSRTSARSHQPVTRSPLSFTLPLFLYFE
ncbi:hypothetical protein MSAN_00494900 [Mycena sanguinolenta]|uniref:Uncharacterized protein n=1 Tax=Mycena sanguinolenta TaxID=230812 RepID=A0A8H6Z8J2_9AGAR|nr:hypothetical protein MSAN_00494900 [Mycena sanguinolenta]